MASNYISNETIIGDGIIKEFTLANNFKAGTIIIRYNDKIFYEFKEKKGETDKIIFDFPPETDDVITVSYYKPNEPTTLNASRYVSVRQIIELSRIENLINASDTDIERLIREVEGYIDIICGYHAKLYSNQSQILTFPRYEDDLQEEKIDYVGIPKVITQAALYAVENIFLMGAPSAADIGEESIESERLGDYSYKKVVKADSGSHIETARKVIGNRAFSMMRGYIRKTGAITVDNIPDNMKILNSRKQFLLQNQ